jgi:hypothetical protein
MRDANVTSESCAWDEFDGGLALQYVVRENSAPRSCAEAGKFTNRDLHPAGRVNASRFQDEPLWPGRIICSTNHWHAQTGPFMFFSLTTIAS